MNIFNSPEWFLWKKRYMYDLKQKIKLFKLTIDWIVALYIVFPLVIFGSVFYYENIKSPPIWWDETTAPILLCLLFVLYLLPTVRPLFAQGDEGLLFPAPLSPHKFIYYNWMLDFGVRFATMVVVWLLISPFLLQLNWSISGIIVQASLLFVFRVVWVQVEWFLMDRSRWVYYIAGGMLLILSLYLWSLSIQYVNKDMFAIPLILSIGLIMSGLLLLIRNRYHHWPWSLLIEKSVEKRISFTSYLLEGKPKKISTRTRRPAHLLKGDLGVKFFPENALFFWYLKMVLRKSEIYRLYLMVAGYSLGAIILVPIWWISGIILVIVLLMLGEISIKPFTVDENPMMSLYPFTYQQKAKGLGKGPFLFVAVIGVIGAIIVTFHLGNWLLLIPFSVVAVTISWIGVQLSLMRRNELLRV